VKIEWVVLATHQPLFDRRDLTAVGMVEINNVIEIR
jgi:hypothetical protein